MYPGRSFEYTTSQNASGFFVRGAEGAFDGWFHSNRSNGYTGREIYGSYNIDRIIAEFAPDPLNGVGVLSPNVISVKVGEYLRPLGTMPGLRYMRMDNYLSGDEFSLGSDTWKVLPWYQKGGYSYERAMAFLKVV